MKTPAPTEARTSALNGHILPLPEKLGSVLAAVAADLLEGMRITHKDVWLSHGSARLAHQIFSLRERGWPIATEEIEVPTSDGRLALIGRYYLPKHIIDQVGERGRLYVAEVREARKAKRRAA